VWSNVESYRKGGGPLLVILDNQILALGKHLHQTYEWHSECFAYPVQHVTDCTKGHAAADELVRFIILDYIGVVRQVLDGTRGALSGGQAIKRVRGGRNVPCCQLTLVHSGLEGWRVRSCPAGV